MQDEDAHLRAPVARGERLAVRPDAQHRVALARVELGYDGDLHDSLTTHMPTFTSAGGWPGCAALRPRAGRDARRGRREPRPQPPRASRRRPRAQPCDRSAVASITPQRQACSRARAAQWRSKPQPMRSGGKGSSVENVERAKAVTGPISTKRCLAHHAARASACQRPGRVGVQVVRRLSQIEREALRKEQEAIEEVVGQLHVVVDHQQPIVARYRRPPHLACEQEVEVLELAEISRRSGVQLDIVA